MSTLSQLSQRCSQTIVFSFAPLTRSLSIMHKAGKLSHGLNVLQLLDRFQKWSSAIVCRRLRVGKIGRSERVSKGFYKSQAMELLRI